MKLHSWISLHAAPIVDARGAVRDQYVVAVTGDSETFSDYREAFAYAQEQAYKREERIVSHVIDEGK